jgi:PUA-domain protein
MKRKCLSKSEIKELNILTNCDFHKKDRIEIVDDKFYVKDKECLFFIYNEKIIPTVKMLLKKDLLPEVIVDMGAVKFIVNGADVMRPGIVEISDFEKDSFVVVKDVNNKKPLIVGVALLSSDEMKETSSGCVVKNIHYVGDDIWNII